jgi:hypothetical protein
MARSRRRSKKKFDWNNYLPHLIVLLLIAAIAIGYVNPTGQFLGASQQQVIFKNNI